MPEEMEVDEAEAEEEQLDEDEDEESDDEPAELEKKVLPSRSTRGTRSAHLRAHSENS